MKASGLSITVMYELHGTRTSIQLQSCYCSNQISQKKRNINLRSKRRLYDLYCITFLSLLWQAVVLILLLQESSFKWCNFGSVATHIWQIWTFPSQGRIFVLLHHVSIQSSDGKEKTKESVHFCAGKTQLRFASSRPCFEFFFFFKLSEQTTGNAQRIQT